MQRISGYSNQNIQKSSQICKFSSQRLLHLSVKVAFNSRDWTALDHPEKSLATLPWNQRSLIYASSHVSHKFPGNLRISCCGHVIQRNRVGLVHARTYVGGSFRPASSWLRSNWQFRTRHALRRDSADLKRALKIYDFNENTFCRRFPNRVSSGLKLSRDHTKRRALIQIETNCKIKRKFLKVDSTVM